ncbi:nuclear pore membrane glycoprotein 210-like [Homalodisca vitripennis]|uniref:nuclear pore membrane glycoprotein 210-like n=1 Tax=Homalodisca vitripennis TaxID=197043 RepID=UPI001EEA7E72|nr:nuclear pore membrane glycoprotein 210-like [Homalodisca vitripennis]
MPEESLASGPLPVLTCYSWSPLRGWLEHCGPGRALVKYALSDTITTSTLVQVFPVQAIVFLSLNGRNLTNWGSFSVPLLLMSEHDSIEKSTNLLAHDNHCPSSSFAPLPQQLPFDCEIRFNSPMTPVDIHHVFHVQPSFSIQTGLYSCHFEALNSLSPNTSVLTSNVTLRAISDNLVSEPLVIPFLPSVFLPSKELLLSDKLSWIMLPVIGIPQVLSHIQVFSSNELIMSVAEAKRPDATTVMFQVTILSLAPTTQGERQLYVYVYSPLTGQNITVPVLLNVRGGTISAPCIVQPAAIWYTYLESLWGTATSLISIFVIIVVLWYSNIFNWTRLMYPPPSVLCYKHTKHYTNIS